MASPTQRALADCKDRGWMATVVERWIPHAKKRMDAFGFGDLLVVDDQPGALLLQVTTTSNAPSRCVKITEQRATEAVTWLSRGNRVEVWGYAKRGAVGKRKLWTLKRYVMELSQEDDSDSGDLFITVRIAKDDEDAT